MTNLASVTLHEFNERFGTRLRHRRKNVLNLTQKVVATRIGVTRYTIMKYEQGLTNPSCYHLYNLSRAIEVCPGWLVDDDPPNLGAFHPMGEETLRRLIGSNIKVLRKNQFMDQTELAIQGGVTRPYLSNVEIGKEFCSAYRLYRFAKLLRVSTNDLYNAA